MFVLMRQLFALALRHLPCSVLGCAVVINMLSWQGASASASALSTQQAQPASFILRPAKGNCTPVVGYGAHFPPGSTVYIEGPSDNGRLLGAPGDNVEITQQVAADGTFTVTFKPCPRQVVSPVGTSPVADGDQFTFTADALVKSGVGTDAVWVSTGVGTAAFYTVSGLGNAKLPRTGIAANGVGIVQVQLSPFVIVLVAAMALVALGGCLLLLERIRHQKS